MQTRPLGSVSGEAAPQPRPPTACAVPLLPGSTAPWTPGLQSGEGPKSRPPGGASGGVPFPRSSGRSEDPHLRASRRPSPRPDTPRAALRPAPAAAPLEGSPGCLRTAAPRFTSARNCRVQPRSEAEPLPVGLVPMSRAGLRARAGVSGRRRDWDTLLDRGHVPARADCGAVSAGRARGAPGTPQLEGAGRPSPGASRESKALPQTPCSRTRGLQSRHRTDFRRSKPCGLGAAGSREGAELTGADGSPAHLEGTTARFRGGGSRLKHLSPSWEEMGPGCGEPPEGQAQARRKVGSPSPPPTDS